MGKHALEAEQSMALGCRRISIIGARLFGHVLKLDALVMARHSIPTKL